MVIGVDNDAEHALACVEEVTKLPDEPDKKEVALIYSFTDNPSGTSATQIHPIQEADEFLENRGIEYDVNESSDDPMEIITGFIGERDADLIVTAKRRRSPAGGALFESITQTMILSSDHPVIVTGSTKRKRQYTRSRAAVISAEVQ